MYTLHHDAEIRGMDQVEELNSLPISVKPEALKLGKQVASMFDAELNLKDYRDDYTEALREIIESNIAGQEVITLRLHPSCRRWT